MRSQSTSQFVSEACPAGLLAVQGCECCGYMGLLEPMAGAQHKRGTWEHPVSLTGLLETPKQWFGGEYEESGFRAVVAVHGLLCLVPSAHVFKHWTGRNREIGLIKSVPCSDTTGLQELQQLVPTTQIRSDTGRALLPPCTTSCLGKPPRTGGPVGLSR